MWRLANRNAIYTIARWHSTQIEELEIPVDWGVIAAKWWGSPSKRPVLCIHGWLDNCGTFDTLIPLLRTNASFLTIDLPGHGFSSPFPVGFPVTPLDFVIIIRRLMEYFKWPKLSLMGHSWGAMHAFEYCLTFPESVDFLISMDALLPLYFRDMSAVRSAAIDDFLRYDALRLDNDTRPKHTMDELVHKLHIGGEKSVDLNKCRYLLTRNIRRSNDPTKFIFSGDVRMKVFPTQQTPLEEILEGCKKFKAPLYLYNVTENTTLFRFGNKERFPQAWKILTEASRDAQFFTIQGTHHVHLNNPEKVAHIINTCLDKYYVYDVDVPGQLERFHQLQIPRS